MILFIEYTNQKKKLKKLLIDNRNSIMPHTQEISSMTLEWEGENYSIPSINEIKEALKRNSKKKNKNSEEKEALKIQMMLVKRELARCRKELGVLSNRSKSATVIQKAWKHMISLCEET